MMSVRPEIAVGGIAFDARGRVLLIQRAKKPNPGLWTIPGGRVELAESLHAACVREMLEETGLLVEVGPLIEVVERVGYESGHPWQGVPEPEAGAIAYHYVIHDFRVSIVGGELRAADDARDAGFFSRADLERLPLTPGLMPVLRRAWPT